MVDIASLFSEPVLDEIWMVLVQPNLRLGMFMMLLLKNAVFQEFAIRSRSLFIARYFGLFKKRFSQTEIGSTGLQRHREPCGGE